MNQFKKGDIIIHEPPYDNDNCIFEVIEVLSLKNSEYILKFVKNNTADNISVTLIDRYILHEKYMKQIQFEKEMKELINEI